MIKSLLSPVLVDEEFLYYGIKASADFYMPRLDKALKLAIFNNFSNNFFALGEDTIDDRYGTHPNLKYIKALHKLDDVPVSIRVAPQGTFIPKGTTFMTIATSYGERDGVSFGWFLEKVITKINTVVANCISCIIQDTRIFFEDLYTYVTDDYVLEFLEQNYSDNLIVNENKDAVSNDIVSILTFEKKKDLIAFISSEKYKKYLSSEVKKPIYLNCKEKIEDLKSIIDLVGEEEDGSVNVDFLLNTEVILTQNDDFIENTEVMDTSFTLYKEERVICTITDNVLSEVVIKEDEEDFDKKEFNSALVFLNESDYEIYKAAVEA